MLGDLVKFISLQEATGPQGTLGLRELRRRVTGKPMGTQVTVSMSLFATVLKRRKHFFKFITDEFVIFQCS